MKKDSSLLILLAFLLLGGGYAAYTMSRGLRNNNPLNIEDDGTDWEGLDTPRNDSGPGRPKLRFTSPEYGFRAGKHIMTSYVNIDGIAPTVDALIRRWSATDQDAYVARVARDLGVDPSANLDLFSVLPAMFASMTSQENGFNPYSVDTIQAGLNLA
jgi:hypothetical protein